MQARDHQLGVVGQLGIREMVDQPFKDVLGGLEVLFLVKQLIGHGVDAALPKQAARSQGAVGIGGVDPAEALGQTDPVVVHLTGVLVLHQPEIVGLGPVVHRRSVGQGGRGPH